MTMRSICIAVLLTAGTASAQDMAKFYEADAALNHGDCEIAAKLFESLTGPIRNEDRFLRAAAKAHACASSLDRAKAYYEELQRRHPQDEGIAKDLGDVAYRLRVKTEQQRQQAERKARLDEIDRQRADFERGVCLRNCNTNNTLCRNSAGQRRNSCWSDEGGDCAERGREDYQQCTSDHQSCEADCRRRWGN
jgi:hypothetical protein